MLKELFFATLETLYLTFAPLLFSYLLAIPIGFLCNETDTNGLFPNRFIRTILNGFIAVGRAIPFVVLMILALPFTRWLIGTGIGNTAVVVPLTLCATPFVARIVETSLREVDPYTIEASKVDGASKLKTMWQIEFKQVLPQIVDGIGVTSIAILGYTTMSGTLGGGGLGTYAIVYGLQRYDWFATLYATLIIVVITFIIQTTCRFISKKLKG